MIVYPVMDSEWGMSVDPDELETLKKVANRRNCTIAAVITGIIKTEIEFFENEETGGP